MTNGEIDESLHNQYLYWIDCRPNRPWCSVCHQGSSHSDKRGRDVQVHCQVIYIYIYIYIYYLLISDHKITFSKDQNMIFNLASFIGEDSEFSIGIVSVERSISDQLKTKAIKRSPRWWRRAQFGRRLIRGWFIKRHHTTLPVYPWQWGPTLILLFKFPVVNTAILTNLGIMMCCGVLAGSVMGLTCATHKVSANHVISCPRLLLGMLNSYITLLPPANINYF